MELIVVEGLRTLKLDLVLTLALAAGALFVGSALQRRVGLLSRSSIPAAAIGGLLFALVVLVLRGYGAVGVAIDGSLKTPLQTVFFTTIGLGATWSLLRAGGWRMGFFLLLVSLAAVAQNVLGISLARLLGAPVALGVICGSLTLTGGPATGLAFTDVFTKLGVEGAGALIIASATFGIFVSSLVGNPVANLLIRRFRLAPAPVAAETQRDEAAKVFWAIGAVGNLDDRPEETMATDARAVVAASLSGAELLRTLLIILAVMGVGALLSLGLTRARVTLPGYVGAMLVAALVRNVDDRKRWLRLDMRAVEAIGAVALALFLVLALMDLKLWQLAGLAVPMLIILCAQVVLTIAYAALVTFGLMGRDYEAAVTASGQIGFGLGITPNAVANMEALTARHGPAPRSFLIVPIVGAFFIDLPNALIITLFANLIG